MDLQKIVSLSKRRGFVFQSSEIYGGFEATYDFGPLGAEVLRNLRNEWWKEFVYKDPLIVGLDSATISHPRVWEASGHVESFADAMVEDLVNGKRYRADHIIEDFYKENNLGEIVADGMSLSEIDELIESKGILSPDGNKFSKAKKFNNLVEVEVGTIENSKSKAYLRGETCQPIFYNYQLVKDSLRKKIPFGVAQIGKAYRNEIKVGPYFFRTREFEQMEVELFIHPNDHKKYFKNYMDKSKSWIESFGVSSEKLRFREQDFKERAHYNKVAVDLEYNFPFGWKEFQGVHYRGDWDLSRHGEFSNTDFTYIDDERGDRYIPHVVEYSIGLNRLMLLLLCDAYTEDDDRVILKLDKRIAPFKAAIFPLVRNKPEIVNLANEIFLSLRSKGIYVDFDDRGNIGKRYYSQDEIGTPYTITVDYDSLEKNTVTVRDRDTTKQETIKISEIEDYIL